MKRKAILSIVALITLGYILFHFTKSDKQSSNEQQPFPDFGHMVSPSVVEKDSIQLFKLSQNYPKSLPKTELPDFFKIDYQKNWKEYLLAVQKYCFEGNTNVEFRPELNKTRDWYHMPWQHYGANGREGFHGLTKEAPVAVGQLGRTQTYSKGGAWAVAFYNDKGGYTIGKVWQNHLDPDANKMEDMGGFPEGTVMFKLLFLSMPKDTVEKQIPYLRNGLWWKAYANYNFKSLDREVVDVVLIQMDVMIKDFRAPSGWILGNYKYNGQMNNSDKFYNLVPLGIMWGDDPENTTNTSNPIPDSTYINPELKQTIINPDRNELPPSHLGWNGRLNGPMDNSMSSCYSCHSAAEYPQLSPISPLFDPKTSQYVPGSPQWMRWFKNYDCNSRFDEGAVPTDFSLQMAEALQNFDDWEVTKDGSFSNTYNIKEFKKHKDLSRRNRID
jgi:hypothetical protein